MTDSGEVHIPAVEALEPTGSSITRWAAGIVLAASVGGTALLIGLGSGKVQELDLRVRALEDSRARAEENAKSEHEWRLRMETSLTQADERNAADLKRIEVKLDRLLERQRGR